MQEPADTTLDLARKGKALLPQDALPALDELCRRFHVRELVLFGSANTDQFDPKRSDIDFIVEFDRSAGHDIAADYFGFKEEAEALFGRSVELMRKGPIRNPYLRRSVERNQRQLFPRT
jgi:predicted nucleotidyltransferase